MTKKGALAVGSCEAPAGAVLLHFVILSGAKDLASGERSFALLRMTKKGARAERTYEAPSGAIGDRESSTNFAEILRYAQEDGPTQEEGPT